MASLIERIRGRAGRIWRKQTLRFRSPARAAIIGYGAIASDHAFGYEATGRAVLVAVSDVRAQALANAVRGQAELRTYRDYRQLLTETRPEIVSIATWPDLRLEVVEAAVAAGVRGILCEKPMALSMAEVDAMLLCCESAGVKLAIGHQYRFHPMFASAADLIRSGRLGRIHSCSGQVASTLANNGPHLMDIARFILRDPRALRVSCECDRNTMGFNRGLPAEDGSIGEVEFDGGIAFRFRTGSKADSFLQLEVNGDGGTLLASARELRLNGESVAVASRSAEYLCRRQQFMDFIRWTRGERQRYEADARQAAASTEVVLAAYEAARRQEVVELPLANRGDVITALYPDARRKDFGDEASGTHVASRIGFDRRLGLDGGKRTVPAWFSSRPSIGIAEYVAVAKVLHSRCLNSTDGSVVRATERAFARAYGSPKAVASSSGTAALHVAMAALNLEPGDEVITTPLTDMGTVIPILWSGCIPVFADVNPLTGNCTVETIAARATPRTRAVVLVHLFGRPADPGPVVDYCRSRGIAVIEDCSQAHFAEFNGRKVGTFGDFGCLSLQQSKQITCGDGGITLVNDSRYAHRAALFVDKAWNRTAGTRSHEFLGLNYRMTELQGAVASCQLRRLPGIIRARRSGAEQLLKELNAVPGVQVPALGEGRPAWWIFNFAIDEKKLGLSADGFAEALIAEGVHCKRGYIPRPLFEEEVIRDQKTFGGSRYPFNLRDRARQCADEFPGYQKFVREQILVSWSNSVRANHIKGIAAAVRKVADVAEARLELAPVTPDRVLVGAGVLPDSSSPAD